MFDLNLTQKLAELFSVAPPQRDLAWRQAFFAAVPDASLRALSPQVIQGPDGFPYFALAMPKAGEPFEGFCVKHVLDACLAQGFGAAIFGEPAAPPAWVFSYGDLSSYKGYGRFEGDPADAPADLPPGPHVETLKEGRKVFVGAPSEAFLPQAARAVLARYLKSLGVASPGVALMFDPAMKPSQNLAFNLYRAQFPNPADYDRAMQSLLWFLPRGRGLIGPEPIPQGQFAAMG